MKRQDLAKNAVTSAKVKDRSLKAKDLTKGLVFGKTVLVRSNGESEAANCGALRSALAGVTDAGPENPVMLKLERGVYDCGATPLALTPFVTIEGAGRTATTILGSTNNFGEGVVRGADDAALNHLALKHQGDAQSIAIVIATAGAVMNIWDVAISVASPTANQVFGVFAEGGSLTLSDVTIRTEASAGQSQGIRGQQGAEINMVNIWVLNQSGAVGNPAALELRDSTATGYGVTLSSNFFGLLGRGESAFDLFGGTVIGGRGAGSTFVGAFNCIAIADGDFTARGPDCT